MRILSSGLVFSLILAGCGGGGSDSAAEAAACSYTRCSSFESHSYALYRPDAVTTPRRLLVLLHGSGQPRDSVEAVWSGKRFADTTGYSVAIPQGSSNVWNYDSDIVWMQRFVASLTKEDGPFEAVFLAGWSNGALLSQQIACRADGQITGVVSYAGPKFTNIACAPSAPIAVALIHGTADAVIPISGSSAFSIASAQNAFNFWRQQNGCDGVVATSPPFSLEYNRSSTTQTASGCRAPVEFTTSSSGEHLPNWDPAVLHAKLADFFNRATNAAVR